MVFGIATFCTASAYAGKKKVLYIDSYHPEYPWSAGITAGVESVLDSINDVELKIIRMDTKRNTSEEFKKAAALKAKNVIDIWKPDIVIASDDNASKYLIAPYFKDADIPFVFCGVNWDATPYGYPFKNATGMVEVSPVLDTIKALKKFTKGGRIGYISVNALSERKSLHYFKEKLKISFSDEKLIDDFPEWKREYLRLQDSVDMLIWTNPIGIKGWDDDQAVAFILKHTKIPTGAVTDDNVRYAMIGRVKIAEEQGWWAGKTALRILNGTSPANIPVTTNKESRLFLNMQLANRLGIKFSMDLLEKATLVEELPDREKGK